MVRHVISWCAMTCAYGNTGVRTFSVYAVLSTAARLWAAAVPSGNAGATPRSREGCGRRSNIRSDWRECRARRGNQRGGRCDRRCYPPRHGTQFRLLLLTSACKVGDRPREEARDEPQAHARAVGALARCLRAAATAADANLGSSATGSRASDAKSAASLFRGSNRSRAWGVDHVRCSDLLGAADDDRAAAAMFYYGYLAAKAGIHVIDVGKIDENVGKVMKQCQAAPDITGHTCIPPSAPPAAFG